MAQTFLQIQNLALGNDFDASTYRATVKQSINDALDDIARQGHLPALEALWQPTLAAGTASYSLPSDFVRLRSVFDVAQASPLEEVDIEDIDLTPPTRGRPWSFAQFAGSVTFYPTPDAVYAITGRYLKAATNLSADTDPVNVAIPDEYAFALVYFTRSRLFGLEDDPEMSAFWRNEYERDLGRLKGDMQKRSYRRPRQIPGRRGMARRLGLRP